MIESHFLHGTQLVLVCVHFIVNTFQCVQVCYGYLLTNALNKNRLVNLYLCSWDFEN